MIDAEIYIYRILKFYYRDEKMAVVSGFKKEKKKQRKDVDKKKIKKNKSKNNIIRTTH